MEIYSATMRGNATSRSQTMVSRMPSRSTVTDSRRLSPATLTTRSSAPRTRSNACIGKNLRRIPYEVVRPPHDFATMGAEQSLTSMRRPI